MQFKPLKGLLLATAAVAGLSFMATNATAAPTSMGVSVQSIGALTVAKLNDMNFGKWLLNYSAEDIYITLDPLTNVATASSDGLGAALATSTAQQIANTSRSGRLNVTIPANAGINNYILHMTVTAPTAFTTATDYAMVGLTYATATEAVAAVTTDGSTPHNVTVLTGGTAETVYFGGTMQVLQQPTLNTPDVGSTFDVDFSY